MGKLLSTVSNIVPLAIGIMNAVEAIFGKGKGDQKKEAYLEGLKGALASADLLVSQEMLSDPKLWTLLGKLADDVIAINNFIQDYRNKK